MLVGRQTECERIEVLLDQARAGDGGVLVIRGMPGVGKSALLRYASGRAGGLRVLRAAGVAWEAELAFSGLLELLGPILGELGELPEPQRRALEVALAIAPGVEHDRFAVGAATLRLLAHAASASPLLLVLDDGQWLDSASLEAVVFAVRRLAGEPVAVLIGVRADHTTALDGADLPTLALEGLDPVGTAALARELLGTRMTERQVDEIHRVTGGYPLAIEEYGRLGDPAEGAARPLPISRSVELAYARDAERCSAEVRTMLVLAAADDSGEVAAVLAAGARLGLDQSALAAAEEEGFLDVAEGRFTFRHPLVRSAVYQHAPAPTRRAVHNALADSLSGEWRADRRAWHRAAGALGPDERIAADLEASAERTRARSGYSAAALALERAAHLTPDPEIQARRLVTAADALWRAGRGGRADELLGAALARTANAALRAEANHVRGRIAHFRGDPVSARTLLVEESAAADRHDPALATEMLATALISALCCDDRHVTVDTASRLAERAGQGLSPGVAAQVGAALAICGRQEAAMTYLSRSVAAVDADADPQLIAYAADSLGWMGRYAGARRLGALARDRARDQGALSALAYAALHLTDYETALGNLSAAVATAADAQAVARETQEPQILAWSEVYLAYIAGVQGQDGRLEAYLADAEGRGVPLWFNGIDVPGWVRGASQLAQGRIDVSIASLEDSIGTVAEHANWVPWTASADLIEAYVHAGRLREAARAVDVLAERVQQEWAIAALDRARGLVADGYDGPFERSVATWAALGVPLEEGRSRLCYGERLRRDRRRVEARAQLRDALAIFDRLRAAPWRDRALTELRATGETIQPHEETDGVDTLTPQELQVAVNVADGLSNKEVAARLFLSTKTIEAHLHRTYRKLGISNRGELGPLLAARPPGFTGPAHAR
jgi:DNA-binding CsgD family transcriptional regulator